ncbi:MAG: NifU family protein [Longimicrobiales bacterium]
MGRRKASGLQEIEAVLTSIRPALHQDGGDVELIDFDEDGVVHVRLIGVCGACPISSVTLRQGIERKLMSAVPGVTGVEAVA